MARTLRALASATLLVAPLLLAGAASADFTPDATTIVGTWSIDYAGMLASMTPEEQAAADEQMTDKSVEMVFNANNTGVLTEVLMGDTTVENATWAVTNITGSEVTVNITDSNGSVDNVWTFVDADTITWTVLGLACNVTMRRGAP